jgi:predicted permease
MPLVVYVCCRLLGVDALATGVCVLLTAMPAGSTTALLASKYNGDEKMATKCVVLSTLLSLGSIPAWSMILLAGL